MARKVNEDRIEDIKKVDAKLGAELEKLATLAARTSAEETPEVKKLRAALSVVEGDAVKQAIQAQINAAAKPPVDLDEAVMELEVLGYNPLEILGTGIKTVINSKSWNVLHKDDKKKAKSAGEETSVVVDDETIPVGMSGKMPE